MVRQLISIQTTPLLLQQSTPLGKYSMERPPVPSMDAETHKSEMTVKHDSVKLNINYDETSASLGYCKPEKFRQKKVSEAKQKVMQHIGEVSMDGEQMARTQGRAYVGICHRKFLGDPYTLQQIFIPTKPTINWSGSGTVKTDFTQYREDCTWRDIHARPNVSYERGKVDISVAQWQKVDIAYNGTIEDVLKIGMGNNQFLEKV